MVDPTLGLVLDDLTSATIDPDLLDVARLLNVERVAPDTPSFSYSLEMILPGASLSAIARACAIEIFGVGAFAAIEPLAVPSAATAASI